MDLLVAGSVFNAPGQHGWHPGEVELQRQMGWDAAVKDRSTFNEHRLREQHIVFHHELAYMPIASLDSDGRPWSSLVMAADGQPGFIECKPNNMAFTIDAPDFDPFVANVLKEGGSLIGGTGVMFSNRRRNKWAGRTNDAQRDGKRLTFSADVNESMGNCPKYINIRDLVPYPQAKAELVVQNLNMANHEALPEEIRNHILRTDTVVLGGYYNPSSREEHRHPARVGANHRGGRPGFVRIRKDNRTIVLPDYSGNRFMQTLGNIESNPVASMSFIDWNNGDMVFITGWANNHCLEDANKLMKGVNIVTILEPTGYVYVKNMLTVRQRPGSEVVWSPYSPPVRHLVEERSESQSQFDHAMVYLTGATLHSLRTASFTFTSSIPLTITPGQAAIIDMGPWSGKAGYQHMSAVGQEARLNDDGVRTWTISSAHVSGPTTEFTVTLALKKHGSITPRLFGVAQTAAERGSTALSATPYEFTQNLIGVGLPLVGVGGGFVLSPKSTSLVWFAGGIGITPFLSMLSAAMEDRSAQTFDITLIVSTREPATIIKLIQRSVSSARAPSHVHLRVILFSTRLRLVDTPEKEHSEEDTIMLRHAGIQEFEQHQGRVALDGIKQLQLDFEGRETFVCGPQLFEKAILEALAQLNVDIAEVKKESFNY